MASPDLPDGWRRAPAEEARRLHEELQRELPRGHVLYDIAVEVVAHHDGQNDDVLLRRLDGEDAFAVVHLTWQAETDPRWPSVVFEGTLAELAEYEA